MNANIVITAWGTALGAPLHDALPDVRPFLKSRKTRRFMGVQDKLATLAAGRALEHAGMSRDAGGPSCGLYLAVGYIPFEANDIDALMDASLGEDGRFSMDAFSTTGLASVPPLLTFRCLPNMPAFHISSNFNVQGPCFVTYPGPGQFYLALEEACHALARGEIERALVGGVAHQQNFLVTHLMQRMNPPVEAARLVDAAGCLLLERQETASARGVTPIGHLAEMTLSYVARDPFTDPGIPSETFSTVEPPGDLGAASLPVMLSRAEPGVLFHTLMSRDGIHASSSWEVMP